MPESTFKHSGAMGDIIYAIPTIQALGGGILYLDTKGGRNEPFVQKFAHATTTRFNLDAYNFLRPLLVQQPCLKDVRIWQGEKIDYNLDAVRAHLRGSGQTNLRDLHLRAFGFPPPENDDPWLIISAPPITLDKDIMVNRTLRYQSKYSIWSIKRGQWLHRAMFLGTEDEHRFFEYTFTCTLPYYKSATALEIAQVLKGCHQLIANQSLIMAIAIGLGVAYIQEVYEEVPNCIFKRENAEYF